MDLEARNTPPRVKLTPPTRNGDADAARHMLDPDPSLARSPTPDGVSAILLACYHGHGDLAAELARAHDGPEIFEAAATGLGPRLDRLLDDDPSRAQAYSADGWTPLHLAAYCGRPDAAERLLRAGADLNAVSRGAMANTPLHAATAGGHPAICRALIAAGADPDARQAGGWTALHSAAASGDRELVDLLLERRARPDARNDAGEAPAATAEGKGHHDLAEHLRSRGSDAPS